MCPNSPELTDFDSAADIRRQMAELRCELREDFDGVSATAKDLFDWKHYVKVYPWLTLAMAVAAGFAAVPKKVSIKTVGTDAALALAKQNRVVVRSKPRGTAQSGLAGFLMRMATAAVVRTAIGIAGQKMGQFAGTAAAAAQSPGQPPKQAVNERKSN